MENKIENLLNESELLNSKTSYGKSTPNYNFINETILITGAAGSIGSEIVRQLIVKQLINGLFKALILIDNVESTLCSLSKELECIKKNNIEFFLIDIRDEVSMKWLFKSFKPTMVFHTAAYKHVSLMEDNAYEAVKLNIWATKTLADLSISHNVKKFIFISTDKAVNPISVMGMTKKIAEAYLTYLSSKKKTAFLITRFGNILGSSGSVLPIFLKQIQSGRPITVTNANATRYFISKSRACKLILEIASWNTPSNNLFTFNMGSPIKIIDLAKVLITLNGNHNLIEIIGLRPGEKMHEDIISKEETLEATKHSDIYRVIPKTLFSEKIVTLEGLKSISPAMKNKEIKSILSHCIHKLQLFPTLLFAI